MQISVSPGVRTYPLGGSVELAGKYENLFWDKRREDNKWMYSYWQARAAVASHGLLEASLSYFPISFVELSYASSMTERYYSTRGFDCDLLVCRGNLGRDRATVKVTLGAGSWFVQTSYQKTTARHSDDSKPLVDEVEYLALTAGGDDLETSSFVIGEKTEHIALALLHRQTLALGSGDNNQMQAVVLRVLERPEYWTYGLGRYFSTRHDAGLTAFMAYQWTWGGSLGL